MIAGHKIFRYYYVAQARDIPPDTKVYKDLPEPLSRKPLHYFTLTNKQILFKEGSHKVEKKATKMLYLFDENDYMYFIPFDEYLVVGFDTLEEMEEYLEKVKSGNICGKTERNIKKLLPWKKEP